MTLLPRPITLPAALMAAAAGCMLLSLLFASTKTTSSHSPHHRDDEFMMNERRQLAIGLMDKMERVRYQYNDPQTTEMRDTHLDLYGIEPADASSFWWKDIHYNQDALCGQMKCFFLSVSDPTNGYLIWDPSYSEETAMDEALGAYDYATKLESEYNIRQFFSSPPFQMETPEDFERQLDKKYVSMYKETKSLIIQPSRTAPEGSIIIRCYNSDVLLRRLDYIIQFGKPNSKQRLVEELKSHIPIVQSHQELIKDFQLMIDLEGQTYYLDFDRVFRFNSSHHHQTKKRVAKNIQCLENAIAYVTKSMSEKSHNLGPDVGLGVGVE